MTSGCVCFDATVPISGVNILKPKLYTSLISPTLINLDFWCTVHVQSNMPEQFIHTAVWATVRRDAIQENNSPQIKCRWKDNLLRFATNKHPKYVNLGMHLLRSMEGAASQRVRYPLLWDRTVNNNGGDCNNISQAKTNKLLNGAYKGNFINQGISAYLQLDS